MIRPRITETIGALGRAVKSAGLEFDGVDRILLVGGSSRIPLVAEMVREATGRPIAVDAHPKHSMALGAAMSRRRGARPRRERHAVARRPARRVATGGGCRLAGRQSRAAGPDRTGAVPVPAGRRSPVRRASRRGDRTLPPSRLALRLGRGGVAAVAHRREQARPVAIGGAGSPSCRPPSGIRDAVGGVVANPSASVASSAPSAHRALVGRPPSPSADADPDPTPTPATPTPTPAGRQARINGITVSGGTYVVDYAGLRLQPGAARPARPLLLRHGRRPEAGVPGSGPWFVYAGPMPFKGYKVSDRPCRRDPDVHPRRQRRPLGHPGHRQLRRPAVLSARTCTTIGPSDLATDVRPIADEALAVARRNRPRGCGRGSDPAPARRTAPRRHRGPGQGRQVDPAERPGRRAPGGDRRRRVHPDRDLVPATPSATGSTAELRPRGPRRPDLPAPGRRARDRPRRASTSPTSTGSRWAGRRRSWPT